MWYDNMSIEEILEEKQKQKKEYNIKLHPEDYDKNGNRTYKYPEDFSAQEDIKDYGSLILYLIIILAGSIFYDRWLIWILATFIYLRSKNKYKK